MLHVLLTILKIIGILLLVILGIILVLILLVLFVPIRYRVHVRKVQDLLQADGGATWLLRLIRIDAAYEDMNADVVISIAGKKIKTLHWPRKNDEDQASSLQTHESASTDEETQSSSAGEQIENDSAKAQIEGDLAKEKQDQESAKAQTESDLAKEKQDQESAKAQIEGDLAREKQDQESAGMEAEGESSKDDINEFASELKKKVQESKAGKALSQIVSVLLGLIEKLLNLALRLLELPYEIYDKMDTAESRIAAKFSAIRKKVEPFLSIEGEHVIGKLWAGLKHLGRCYGPRKISGYLNFGTSYPDMTGKIAGLVYVLLPQAGSEYAVEPDFYNAVLETDTVITGHIRLNHVAWIAIRLLLDKEFWILLRKIRGKEKANNHKGPKAGRSDSSKPAGDMNGAEGEDDGLDAQASDTGAEGAGNRNLDDDHVDQKKRNKKAGKKKRRKKKTGNRKVSKKR